MRVLFLFLENIYRYTIDILPALTLCFLISGFLHESIPINMIAKYLSGVGIKPLIYATSIWRL